MRTFPEFNNESSRAPNFKLSLSKSAMLRSGTLVWEFGDSDTWDILVVTHKNLDFP